MSNTKESAIKPLTSEQNSSVGCCGGPATENSNACCVKDEQAKAEGKSGCGCRSNTD